MDLSGQVLQLQGESVSSLARWIADDQARIREFGWPKVTARSPVQIRPGDLGAISPGSYVTLWPQVQRPNCDNQ